MTAPERPDIPPPPEKERRWKTWVIGAVVIGGLLLVGQAVANSPYSDTVESPPGSTFPDGDTISDTSEYSDLEACELVEQALAEPILRSEVQERVQFLRDAFAIAEPGGAVESAVLDALTALETNDQALALQAGVDLDTTCAEARGT